MRSLLQESGASRLVAVVGEAGSGADALARVLRILCSSTPGRPGAPTLPPAPGAAGGPGRPADGSSWPAELHARLLERADVDLDDARPDAWFDTGRVAAGDQHREELAVRLGAQLAAGSPVVVDDPALAWFVGLWAGVAERLAVDASYVVVVGSLSGSLSGPPSAASADPAGRAAAWLNRTLYAERSTRGRPRVLVNHRDLAADWTVPVHTVGERLGLTAVTTARANALRAVHELVEAEMPAPDPSPLGTTLPEPLRELTEATEQALDRLAAGEEDPAVHHRLDELRTQYVDLYRSAEAIADSTTRAVARRLERQRRRHHEEREGRQGLQAELDALRAAPPRRRGPRRWGPR